MKYLNPDPQITITCWKGRLSALAARQRVAPAELMTRIRQHGLQRGGNWEIEITSPQSMITLRRVLDQDDEY